MFRSVLFVSSVLLLSAWCVSSQQDPGRQWGPNGVGCDFKGQGGELTVFPPGDNSRFIRHKFLKLQEVDVNGNVVAQAEGFAFFGGFWGLGTVNPFGAKALEFTIGSPVLRIHSVNNTAPDFTVKFEINTFLFLQNITYDFAGETIVAKAGQVKWQLQVQDWKFQSPSNKLRYALSLISSQSANNTAYKRLDHVPGTKASFAIGFGVGNIIVPTVAQLDGNNVTITSNVNYEGGQLAIVWEFPAFNHTLLYDPITAASDLVVKADTTTPSSAVSEKPMSALVMAAIAVAMWAMKRQN